MSLSTRWTRESRVHVRIRTVEASRPRQWLTRGWQDLRTHWRVSLVHGVLLSLAGGILIALGSTHPFLMAAAITGFLLVGPLVTTGVAEVSRRAERGERASFDDSLEGFTRNRNALFDFAVILGGIAALWFVLSGVLLRSVFELEAPTLGQVLYDGVLQLASGERVLGYVLIGGALAAIAFLVSAVSVPLIIDRPEATAADAVRTSIRAVRANLPAIIVWGAMLIVLTAIGFGTFLVGMIWIAPLLGHATWHAYRDLTASDT